MKYNIFEANGKNIEYKSYDQNVSGADYLKTHYLFRKN